MGAPFIEPYGNGGGCAEWSGGGSVSYVPSRFTAGGGPLLIVTKPDGVLTAANPLVLLTAVNPLLTEVKPDEVGGGGSCSMC